MNEARPTDARWAVRRASADDASAIAPVARAAWSDAYAGLLRPATIATFLDVAYSRSRLMARIAADHVYVALEEGTVVAFADASVVGDRIALHAIYALPEIQGRGPGSALLETLLRALPSLPVAADVVLGNRKGEVFYERRGFVPRETIEVDLFGEPVVQRRWWREPESPNRHEAAGVLDPSANGG